MMKITRYWWGLFALCTAASLPGQALGATPRSYALTGVNSGETVVVSVGDHVVISLPAHAGRRGALSIQHPANGRAKLVAVHDKASGYTADFRATQPGLVTVKIAKYAFTVDIEQPQLAQLPTMPAQTRPKSRVLAAPRAPVALIAAPIPVGNSAGPVPRAGTGLPGNGTTTYSDGSTYVGGLKNGLPFGDGTLTFTTNVGNVKSETGDWDEGVLTHGTVVLRDGTTYYGALDAQGRLTGPGRFDDIDGSVLKSTFVAGLYSGPTLWLEPPDKTDPKRPAGSISVDVEPPANQPSGAATERFDDGTTLVGTLVSGVFVGPATYVSFDPITHSRSSFHADFTDGVLQGPFVSTDSNGITVMGTITNGTTQGPATLTTRTGVKCRGAIVDVGDEDTGDFLGFSGVLDSQARPDGYGTTGCPGDEQITGQWFHGKMVGKMIDRLPSGIIYVVDVGPYPTDRLVGRAYVKLANDDRAIGYLAKSGALSGRGSYLTASTNFLIRGKWVDGTIRGTSRGHGYFVLDGPRS